MEIFSHESQQCRPESFQPHLCVGSSAQLKHDFLQAIEMATIYTMWVASLALVFTQLWNTPFLNDHSKTVHSCSLPGTNKKLWVNQHNTTRLLSLETKRNVPLWGGISGFIFASKEIVIVNIMSITHENHWRFCFSSLGPYLGNILGVRYPKAKKI